MKLISLGLGVIVAATGVGMYLFTRDISILYKVCGIAGGLGLLLSGISIGAFVGGMQIRANYFSETKQNTEARYQFTISSFLFSLPNIIAVATVLFL